MNYPNYVKIVEVGPRDGLQNESMLVPAEIKIELIQRLTDTGLHCIEAGSFVSPKWVPQMENSDAVYTQLIKKPGVRYPLLVPNEQGLQRALAVHAKEIAVFTTASEQFSVKNANCTVKESLKRIQDTVHAAHQAKLWIRAYVSCVWGCPYTGEIPAKATTDVVRALQELGVDEISLGDTIGVGTPLQTLSLLEQILAFIPKEKLAVHFHDTYGQALANIFAALQIGIHIIDTSIGGLGGCPYAPNAGGNVATEDVIYLLNGMKIKHNVDFIKILKVSEWITTYLNKKTLAKVSAAFLSQPLT